MKLIGKGASAEIVKFKDNEVTKVITASYVNVEQVESEIAAQKFAFDSGLPVPRVLSEMYFNTEGKPCFDMQYIKTNKKISTKVLTKMNDCVVENLIYRMLVLQLSLHEILANNTIKKTTDIIHKKIDKNNFLNDSLKKFLQKQLVELNGNSMSLCHCDFAPSNILFDAERDKLWVIDWMSTLAGNPLYDVCITFMKFNYYSISPHITESTFTREASIYLRHFENITGIKVEKVLEWLPIYAAVHLGSTGVENPDANNMRGAKLLEILSKFK